MSLDFTDDQSTLVQVMAWWRQATSHYLSRCWPRSLSSYGVIRPQWVNSAIIMIFPYFQVSYPRWHVELFWISEGLATTIYSVTKFCTHWPSGKVTIISLQRRHSEHDGVSNVYSTVCPGAYQRQHQSSASLAFVRGIHRYQSPVNSPRKGPITREMFSFYDVIMRMTSWHGNIRHITGQLWPVHPHKEPAMRRQLSKQWSRWWFETLPRSLWRHWLGNKRLPNLMLTHIYDIVWRH